MTERREVDPSEKVIEVKDVKMSFDGRIVLEDVSFSVTRGSVCVILGGSGCGKSTLLRILIGAYRPDAGEVKLFGEDILKVSEDRLDELRKRFGILFQAGALYSSMNVADNVALPIREHTDLHENIIDIMVHIKLEQVGMNDFADLMPDQLSGGMKKRVALARALALDPEILFYDEPTSGLDPVASAVIDQLILDLSRKLGVTSLVVTHSMESAYRIADHIVMLHGGGVIAEGTPDEIRACPDPIVQQFIHGRAEGPMTMGEVIPDAVAEKGS